MIFPGQVMTLTWGQILKIAFKSHHIVHSTRLEQKRDAGKGNVETLLSQKLLQEDIVNS